MMKNTFGVDFILTFQANIGDCLFTWDDAPSFDCLGAMPLVLIAWDDAPGFDCLGRCPNLGRCPKF